MGVLNLIWRLPAKVLNSAASSLTSSQPWISQGGSRKSARRRPLHTCGASCLAIARRACARAQDLDAPLGTMAKRSVSIFNAVFPFARTMAHKTLALLIVMDDHILAVEGRIEAIFPRSAPLFDGIDGLVRRAEAVPEKLDDAARRFPLVMHQFPLLDWAVVHLISWLNFLLTILIRLGSTNAREKEITIDVNCSDAHSCKAQDKLVSSDAKEHTKLVQFEQPYSYADAARPKSVHFDEREVIKAVPTEVIHLSVKRLHSWKSRIKALEEPLYAGDSPMYSSYQSANSSPVSDCSQEENHPFSQLGCTYKEILERDKQEDDDEREEDDERGKEEEVLHMEGIKEQVLKTN